MHRSKNLSNFSWTYCHESRATASLMNMVYIHVGKIGSMLVLDY